METIDELRLIESALLTNVPENLTKACREILKSRVEKFSCKDKAVSEFVNKMIALYVPEVDFEILNRRINEQKDLNKNEILGWALLAVASIVANIFTAGFVLSAVLKVLETLIVGFAGFKIANKLFGAQPKVSEIQTVKMKFDKEAILYDLDKMSRSCQEILLHDQLQSCYRPLLQWVQLKWSESDVHDQQEIEKVMKGIGFEFVEYIPEYSDFFETTKSSRLTEPETTLKAIKNTFSGEIVLKGFVLFPL